jgi:hypothetical protein
LSENIAAMFANANDLATVSSSIAIILLFYSLRCKKILAIICVAVALLLAAVTLETVSRQGLVVLLLGFSLYLAVVGLYRKGKAGFIALVLLISVLGYGFAREYTIVRGAYEYRLGQRTARTAYLRTALRDMSETFVCGKGSSRPLTADGFEPHNTFFYLHIAYGGLCAWTYAIWLVFLSLKTAGNFVGRRAKREMRVELVSMLGIFVVPQLVLPFAVANFGCILPLAILERHIKRRGERSEAVLPFKASLRPEPHAS